MTATSNPTQRLVTVSLPAVLLVAAGLSLWISFSSWKVVAATAGLPTIQTTKSLDDPNRSFVQRADGQIQVLLTRQEKSMFLLKGIVLPLVGLAALVYAVVIFRKW